MTKNNKQIEKLTCIDCEKAKDKVKWFYNTKNKLYEKTQKIPICKTCLKEKINYEDIETVYDILKRLDVVFHLKYWKTAEEGKSDTFGRYMSMANSLHQLEGKTWSDSLFDIIDENPEVTSNDTDDDFPTETEEIDISGDKNKEDVLRMLQYDPFEGELESDKRHLYNKLVDMLDESTLEDGFKLPAVIEIVKGFNQVDKINRALATLTADTKNISKNTTAIKSLIASKKQIMDSMIALAKDNGISVNHNNNKSKGAGTLSGIIKTLQEKGIEEASVNSFDIDTALGMRQVADLSNASIVAQLQFDENDYTSMIMEQREIILKLESSNMSLEEENRLLKKELLKYKS